ncbi:IS30 family transposase, partial [Georgenia sp.]
RVQEPRGSHRPGHALPRRLLPAPPRPRQDEMTHGSVRRAYFCDPHSPWQRGTNENSNGLLRQYFPKGTGIGQHSAARLAAVQDELSNRPRKTLSWASRQPSSTRSSHRTHEQLLRRSLESAVKLLKCANRWTD